MKGTENRKKKIIISIPVVVAVIALIGILVYLKTSNVNISNKWVKNGKILSADSETDGDETSGPIVEGTGSTDNATVKEGTITVYYVDEEGNNLLGTEPVVKTGKVGEWYEEQRVDIPKYTRYGEDPITKAGYYDIGNKDIKFVYKHAEDEVLVSVDREGENNATRNVVNVLFNNARAVTDYGVKVVTKDQDGRSVSGGTFSISKGNQILTSAQVRNGELYFGKIGVGTEGVITYNINQLRRASGYETIDGAIDVNLTSVWDEDTKKFKVTGVTTNSTVASVSLTDNDEVKEIVVEIVNNKVSDAYEVEFIYKAGSEIVNGAKLKVEKSDSIVKEGIIENGSLKISDRAITGEGTDVYTISETGAIEGYESALKDGKTAKVAVTIALDEETGEYTVKGATNDSGITVDEYGNRIIVYIEVTKISEQEPDPEPEEKYDLAMMKFVSKIDDKQTEGREPVVFVNKDDGKFSYSKKNDVEQASNGQKVTYRLRMYNESLEDGKGKRIVETVPAGLVYLPNDETNQKYNWRGYISDAEGYLIPISDITKATVLVTDYLVDREIDGYNQRAVTEARNTGKGSISEYLDFEDVEIVYSVDESKIDNENRIIENIVTIQKNENDDNTENDKTSEKLYVKYFDLDVKKYIEKVVVKDNDGERTVEVGKQKKGKTTKIDVARSKVESTTVIVTYGLEITNIGEIEGYATEITDYIPKDFKLLESSDWVINGETAISSKLEDVVLEPGESTTINVTFEWKLSENNIGSRSNTGKITKYENPFNAKDVTEDNFDKEELLVTIKTGGVTYIIPVAIVLVFAIIGLHVVAKKRNN